MCKTCHSETRRIWGPSPNRPKLDNLEIGNYIILQSCPECHVLWTDSPYEPYASFSYRVVWPHTAAEWRKIHNIDNGQILHQWLTQQIKALWDSLPDEELKNVEFHRKRSYGYYNPIDIPEEHNPNLEQILRDIEQPALADKFH